MRILTLQEEFANRHEMRTLASEFRQPDWKPRSDEEIAADYEAALLELLTRQNV